MRSAELPSSHPTDDAILDLVAGLLEEPEGERLHAHFGSCAPCEARYRERAGSWELGRARIPAQWGGAPELPAVARSRGVSWRVGGLVAAAAAASLVVAIVAGPERRGGAAGDHPFVALPSPEELMVTRGAAPGGNGDTWREGLAAYAGGEMVRASELLSLNRGSAYDQPMRLLYLASSLAFSGRHAEALRTLESVEEASLPEPWRGESRWMRFLLLRSTGRTASAEALLAILSREEGEVGDRARRWSAAP